MTDIFITDPSPFEEDIILEKSLRPVKFDEFIGQKKLVDRGNTVLIIEHNMDVIKSSDWVIDLGPEGGDEGGEIITCGTPEMVAEDKKSYTGHFLKDMLK